MKRNGEKEKMKLLKASEIAIAEDQARKNRIYQLFKYYKSCHRNVSKREKKSEEAFNFYKDYQWWLHFVDVRELYGFCQV